MGEAFCPSLQLPHLRLGGQGAEKRPSPGGSGGQRGAGGCGWGWGCAAGTGPAGLSAAARCPSLAPALPGGAVPRALPSAARSPRSFLVRPPHGGSGTLQGKEPGRSPAFPCPRCRAAPSGCPGPAATLSGWEPGPLPARAGGLQGAPGGAGRPQGEAAAAAWGRDGGARSERVALKTARRRQAHLGTGLPPTAAFSSDLGTAQKPGAVPGVKAAERCA